jgi:predicted metal-dependent hydrolase
MTGVLVLDGMAVSVDRAGASRRARLTIERDGSLRLRAAYDVDNDELLSFLRSKRQWIYAKLAEKELLYAEPLAKKLVDGEGFLYLGRSHQLRIIDNGADHVQLERGRLVLPKDQLDQGYKLIIDWYRSRGLRWLSPNVSAWALRLRVRPERTDVADLGHKWGSAAPDGRVRVHWATLQLRPSLVDYVLAHELAHLQEPHHGPAFWALLGRVMPDYEDRRAQLAREGSRLWFGPVAAAGSGQERSSNHE